MMKQTKTQKVDLKTIEIMTTRIEKLIEKAEKEIKSGKTVGPFKTTENAVDYLKNL